MKGLLVIGVGLAALLALGGTSALEFNDFGGILMCSGNKPDPVGTGNTAAQESGQCAGL